MATSGGDGIYFESPGEAQGIEEGNSGQSQGETQVQGDTEPGATDGGLVVDSVLEKFVRAMENVERSSIKKIGAKLYLSDNSLSDLGCDDKDKDIKDLRRAICKKWLETHGADANVPWFVSALRHIGLYVDAHNLQYENIDEREQGNGTSAAAMSTSPPSRAGTLDNSTIQRVNPSRRNKTGCPVSLRQPCDLFTGVTHIECCDNIEKHYNTRRGQGSESHRVLVEILIGLGGCGKSEILCQYVWNNWSKYKGGVFILNGQSSNYIDFGLKRLLTNVKPNEGLLEEETTPSNIRRLALEWLHECRDWLLVIDNVLEPELIKTYFPDQPQLHDGHILITTRVTQGWNNWYNAMKTRVPHMTAKDSAIYLLRQKYSEPDRPISSADAEQMLSDLKENNFSEYEALMWLGDDGALQGLPLALFQASRYISTCKVTFKKYKDLYFKCRMDVFKNINTDPLEAWLVSSGIDKKFGPALREIVHSNTILVKTVNDQQLKDVGMKQTEITNFNQARQETAIERFAQMVDPSKDDILTTWKMNYDQVCQNKIAREFIQLCSCLSSRVQVALLVDGVQYLNPSSLKDYILSRRRGSTGCCQTVIHERVLELFQHLQQYSFATMIIGQTDDRRAKVDLNRLGAFIVPNLLKEVVFLKLISRDEKIRSLNHAMNILEKLFPKIEDVQADRLDILYSEAVRDYHSIIAFHTLALAHQMESLEQDDITHLNNTNRLFSSVGTYLRRLGRFRDAKTLYKLMVRFSRWRRPPRECDLGEELRCLGKVYYNMKQFKKAKIYFEDSRKVFEKMNGEDDITVAFAMQGLGRVLQNDQDYMKTEQHRDEVEQLLKATLEKKMAYFKKSGENDHYSIAHAKHQLGRFYQDTGNCTKAHDLMKESYEMRNKYWLRKYGTIETVDVAVGMTNFARNYLVGKGNGGCRSLDEAEKLLLEAEKIKQQRMPDSNESYQLALYYLATLYRERGMLEKAKKYHDKIILEEYQKLFTDMEGKKKYAEVYPPEKTIWM